MSAAGEVWCDSSLFPFFDFFLFWQDGGEIDQESERAVCKALVVSIVAKVTKGKANASTEEQFMALCRDVGMQMGLTKVFFQQKAFNSIERLR